MTSHLLSVIVGGAIVCTYGGTARAYDSNEHQWAAAESYRRACANWQQKAAPDKMAVLGMLCNDERVDRYSQAVALSGDYVETADRWLQNYPTGIRESNDFKHFLKLALANEGHFHPGNRETWKEAHHMALAYAFRASSATNPTERDTLTWSAILYEAFADHFLQDAFASGHSGFARGATPPNAAKAFHDKLNRYGRRFKNGRGREWIGYGDDSMMVAQNADGRDVLLATATASIQSVLFAISTGSQDNELETAALLGLPVQGIAMEWTCVSDRFDVTMLGPAADCEPTFGASWESIDAVMKPAEPGMIFSAGLQYSLTPDVESASVFMGAELSRRVRFGPLLGIGRNNSHQSGVHLGGMLEVIPLRIDHWNSPLIHEFTIRGDLTIDPLSGGNMIDRDIFSVGASLGYRLSVQTAAGYQLLWIEPVVGFTWQSTSFDSRESNDPDTPFKRGVYGGVMVGWGIMTGVKGGGELIFR